MSAVTYGDYSRDRAGFLFGLRLGQLVAVVVTGLPALALLSVRAWLPLGVWALGWVVTVVLLVVPVQGRSSVQWLIDLTRFEVGRAMGWSRWQSRIAAGRPGPDTEPDLPGVLAAVRIHDGPPFGVSMRRVAVVQDGARRTWAVTAAVTHPGIGLSDGPTRDRMGAGLATLLEVAARGGVLAQVSVTVRSIPDDGAERAAWMARHRVPGAPAAALAVNADLERSLVPACVRTECFVTVVAPEAQLSRAAREAGGGVSGRALVLHSVMAEVEAQLRGPVQCSAVRWLTSPELAAVIRTGFAPGDRAALVASDLDHDQDPAVAAGVPVSAAGPSVAGPARRSYSHDSWVSMSDTVLLPAQGAVMGALAPVITPSTAGERRCLTVFYPVVAGEKASRSARSREYSAQMSGAVRGRLAINPTASTRAETDKTTRFDTKLVSGRAMTRPTAVATVTIPEHWSAPEYGRRLDSSIRAAGFTPRRLDLAQDGGFVAGVVPLGVGPAQTRTLT